MKNKNKKHSRSPILDGGKVNKKKKKIVNLTSCGSNKYLEIKVH